MTLLHPIEILTSSEMQPYVQKYHVGLVYARVGGHQYWPARVRTGLIESTGITFI